MKVLILYRPNSEHGRSVESFVREYGARQYGNHVETQSIDTREGSATATLYDITQYPAIMILTHDGQVQKVWQGSELPLMDEVAAYARA